MQGVGFRPFIYRLANSHRLAGWVMNTPSGVLLEAQGSDEEVDGFRRAIPEQAPPLAVISASRWEEVPPADEGGFVVRQSGGAGGEVQIAPDGDVCPDCLSELFDPADRRYRYPFINCTNCGPRYTIIRASPTTGHTPPWPLFPCVTTAWPNTRTRAIAGFMPSPMPARSADRLSPSSTAGGD